MWVFTEELHYSKMIPAVGLESPDLLVRHMIIFVQVNNEISDFPKLVIVTYTWFGGFAHVVIRVGFQLHEKRSRTATNLS